MRWNLNSILVGLLVVLSPLALSGCDFLCEEGWFDDCQDPCAYSHDGGCYDDDWDDYTDDGWDDWDNGWCLSSADCPAGQVCHPGDFCVPVVDDCPLTDECLGDPEGYTPEWQGIDPLFVGSFAGDGFSGRVELLIDFYEDHLYGEAQLVLQRDAEPWSEFYWVTVTGSRDGAHLEGQIVDPNAWERTFDATFEAELDTASRIAGNVMVACDQGTFSVAFELQRTSPCGCEQAPGCQANADCPPGQICLEGECLGICFADSDCDSGQVCQEHECVDGCQTECCAAEDCPLGYDCVAGACLNPCVHWCDCAESEDCIDGYCRTP